MTSRSRRSATCDTAKTRIREPPGIAPRSVGRPASAGLAGFAWRRRVLQGKELSFTNLLDLDAAARIVLEFDEPAAVVIKHTNPCGAATGDSAGRGLCPRARCRQPRGVRRDRRAEPADRRRDGRSDRLDIHRGGHRALGRRSRAPVLARKTNMRVVIAPLRRLPSGGGVEIRSILGGDARAGARSRDRGARAPGRPGRCPKGSGSSPGASRPRRSGRRCASPGGSART